MRGTAKADRKRKKKRGRDPYKMLFEELKLASSELITVAELSTEEGKDEAALLTARYLLEFARRFNTPGMSRERCKELSMLALKKQKRWSAPDELEALLKKGGFDVQTNQGEGAGRPEEPSVDDPLPSGVQEPAKPDVGPEAPRTSEPPRKLTILPAEDNGDSREGDKEMTQDWTKGNVGKKQIVLPDGTVREIEDLKAPDALIEVPSNVGSGGVAHVPRDSKMLVCPKCGMDIPDYARMCSACKWTRP